MIDISLYIPLLTKAFLSCVLGQPAKLHEDLRKEAEEQKKLLERVGYFLPIP